MIENPILYCSECFKKQEHWKKNCIYCGKPLYPEGDYEKYVLPSYELARQSQTESYIPVTSNRSKRKKQKHLGMEFTEEELLATGLYPHDKHGFLKGLLISNIFGRK